MKIPLRFLLDSGTVKSKVCISVIVNFNNLIYGFLADKHLSSAGHEISEQSSLLFLFLSYQDSDHIRNGT